MDSFPNALQAHRFLWAVGLLLFIVVATNAQGFINMHTVELTINENETTQFQISVKDILDNAKTHNAWVVISYRCDKPISFFYGKCSTFHHGPANMEMLGFLINNVDAIFKLLELKCHDDVTDGALIFRAFPSASNESTTCKWMVYMVRGPIKRSQFFQDVYDPKIEYPIFEETQYIPEIKEDSPKAYSTVTLIVLLVLIVVLSAGLVFFIITVGRRKKNTELNYLHVFGDQDDASVLADRNSLNSAEGETLFRNSSVVTATTKTAVAHAEKVIESQNVIDAEEESVIQETIATVQTTSAGIDQEIFNQGKEDDVEKNELKYTDSDSVEQS